MAKWGSRNNNNNQNNNQQQKPDTEGFDRANGQGSNNQNNNSRGNGGGYQSGKKNYNNDDNNPFTFVTNLFASQSGNSCTVFLKDDKYGRETIEKLSSLQVGDMLCIRDNNKGGMILSIKRGDQ